LSANDALGVIFALFSALSTAGNRVLLSKPLTYSNPRFVTYMASVTGAFVIFFVSVVTGQTGSLISTPLPLLVLFSVVGVLNSGLSRMLLYLAIKELGANQAESLQPTAVLFSLVFAVILLRESLSLNMLFGGLLIVAGSFLIEGRMSSNARNGNFKVGVTAALLSSLVFAFVLILIRAGLSTDYSFVSAAMVSAAAAFVFNSFLYNPKKLRSDVKSMSKSGLVSICFAAALIAFAQILRYGAFSFTSVVVASPLIGTSPILVVILTRLFAKNYEVAHWKTVLSVSCVVLGAAIISYYSGLG
jgi:drug/metabolite transporter (DMT)-like permease